VLRNEFEISARCISPTRTASSQIVTFSPLLQLASRTCLSESRGQQPRLMRRVISAPAPEEGRGLQLAKKLVGDDGAATDADQTGWGILEILINVGAEGFAAEQAQPD
jgi:hypothetical protein